MKTIVLAYHNMGCMGLRALLENGYDVMAVFTHTDNSKENIWFESVAQVAAQNGIPVFVPEDINHPLWVNKIAAMQPDILFSFYYRNMLKSAILDIATFGALNLPSSGRAEWGARGCIIRASCDFVTRLSARLLSWSLRWQSDSHHAERIERFR